MYTQCNLQVKLCCLIITDYEASVIMSSTYFHTFSILYILWDTLSVLNLTPCNPKMIHIIHSSFLPLSIFVYDY